MAVRIYALAKELKLDSKEVVELCAKAGIPGKGSALASLTDEEVVKFHEFRNKATRRPAASASSKTEQANKPSETGTVSREDYIGPAGASGKPPVLGEKPKKQTPPTKKQAGEHSPQRSAAKSTPQINLAPLPEIEAPQPTQESNEPAPQKPDLKLPADAIRDSKSGARPLADHLRRAEKKRDAETKQSGKPARKGRPSPTDSTPVDPADAGSRGKGKQKKGGTFADIDDDEPKGKKTLLGREQRQASRKRAGGRRFTPGEEEGRPRRRVNRRSKKTGVNTAAPRKENVTVQLPCTVRTLSEGIGIPASQILGILLREGQMGTVNSQIDEEMAEFIAAELGAQVEFKQAVSLEDQLLTSIREQEDTPDSLETRPPVITFLGHVDHGKTSLLDRIIGTSVVTGESGGITQHIRAYQITKDDKQISFVDTPGHEAFTEMRARGANVTDIAVLVVAADDGVMPQTEEAISHARAADVPIVVALNKIDLPGVDVNRAMQGLSTNELLPSEWGGDVEVVRTSAETGEGIEELLDTLLTVAELHEFQANPARKAYGTCLESQQESDRGVISKVIVQNGELSVGDIVVCGQAYGRVKAMYDTLQPNKKIKSAGPSMPVNLTGLNVPPAAGEHFYVLNDIAQAREIAQRRTDSSRAESLTGTTKPHVTLENLFERLEGVGDVATLNMILRADTRGSIEAIQKELTKLEHDEVRIKILQATVGGVSEADVYLADASDAVIIGFNVVPDEGARLLADKLGVQVRRYEVIYKVTEDLKAALEGLLEPEKREVEQGRALVQKVFTISRLGAIAGCRVLAGTIQRNNSRVRVIRNNTIIGDYSLGSLRREKDDVKEVREGMECGIKLDGFNDLKEADVLEVYRIEEVGRKFDD